MDITAWKSQMRKGMAELAILALVEQVPASGTAIMDRLADFPEVGLADGTLYPLLGRLEREGKISGAWTTPSGGGRATKTYTLTPGGSETLAAMKPAWAEFSQQISDLLGGSS